MAWSLLDSTVATTGSGSTGFVVNYPNGSPASGNLLVLGVNGDTTVTTPSNWTLSTGASLVGAQAAYVFWKVAGSSEPSSVTITSNGNHPVAIDFRRYSGAAASPFDLAVNTATNTTGTTTPTLSSGTLAGTGELFLSYAMLHDGGAGTSPAWTGGPTQVADTTAVGTGGAETQHFVGEDTNAGTTALSPNCTWTTAYINRTIIEIAFKPAGGTSGSVNLTTPGVALAAPLLTVTGTTPISLTKPPLALAAPLLTPVVTAQNVHLITPNLALAVNRLHILGQAGGGSGSVTTVAALLEAGLI